MSNTVKTPKGSELPLLNLKGKAYLQVAHRLVWFREDHPDWSIETEYVSVTDKAATARAVIKDGSGRVIATGHKFENQQGFPDFLEKSETGAIGRALALCGYGTQFTDDLEEGERIVDSPVQTKNGPRPIVADQPTAADGNLEPTQYKISFGKWAQRTLEEVHRNHGSDAIWDYIDYIKDSAKKKNQQVTGAAAEFVVRATEFLKAMDGVHLL